ncbi:MAG: hypothetical protein ACN4GM_14350 [Gammaproteobacteria bacterium]
MTNVIKRFTLGLQFSGLSFALLIFSSMAQASLSTDLQDLLSQGNDLNLQMSGTQLTADNMCNELLTINRSTNALIDSIALVNQSLPSPLSVDTDSLTALSDLSTMSVALANEAQFLSLDIGAISTTANMVEISDGLNAMLQLSSDIGTMADRILEMADKILIMSDNIGLMADRIIETQEIQNQNIALTQASILTTQENILTLVSVVSSDDYSLGLQNLLSDGNWLSLVMATTVLTDINLADNLSASATDVSNLKDQFINMDEAISLDAASNTFYINQQSIETLADMSLMLNSLAIVLEGYALASEGLATLISEPSLTSAMQSMLQMSADIGIMANRILEMADLMLAMADNIGVAADNIIATQQLQNINIAATQATILSGQTIAIGIIASAGL